MQLQCPNGCAERRFEALNAPLYVDSAGRYLRHGTKGATYVCATCQSVALDVNAVGQLMRKDQDAPPLVLVCPTCQTQMLPPEDPLSGYVECPACETAFAIEEGLTQLHGTSAEE